MDPTMVNEMMEFNLKIYIPITLKLPPQRINDKTIMNVIISSEKNHSTIEQINICR